MKIIPPYCPNSSCQFHFGTDECFYVKNGFSKTLKEPFLNQRYKCKTCGEQFSENTFSLDFRKRQVDLSENVLYFTMNGLSNNSLAKRFKISEGTIRNRLKTLAKQALLFEIQNSPKVISEDVAYDGFETFTNSQFSPCYINTAVGSHSMFIYHNTFSPLNRKGRMTLVQKAKQLDLLHKFGAYPKDSVFLESNYIFKCLSMKAAGKILFTDEHKTYLRAIKSIDFKMVHKTVNSKVRRDPSNPLFPINRLHNLYRHFISSQKRETISFQKHEAALLEKIQVMKVFQNFMKPKFVKKNRYDPLAHEWSPAMYVGVAEKVLEFKDIFGVRKMKSQMRLDLREEDFYNRSYPFSRQVIAA